jgi:hypothetical protein
MERIAPVENEDQVDQHEQVSGFADHVCLLP